MTALTPPDWNKLFARAWTDPAFREAYEADPRAALKKYGAEMDIDPDAAFSFPPMPDGVDHDKAKAVAQGSDDLPEPMYCC